MANEEENILCFYDFMSDVLSSPLVVFPESDTMLIKRTEHLDSQVWLKEHY